MDTSDRGMLDVERFDLEPNRPLLHGTIENVDPQNIKNLSTEDKIPVMLQMLGVENISLRAKASMIEVEQTINTWPQLASSVALGGAVGADVSRRILLDQYHDSGRYYIDLEELIADKEKHSDDKKVTRLNPFKPVNFEDLETTLRKTISHVNQIKQTLQAIKENNILKMYVDESVLKFMEKREFEQSLTTNENIEATVVFVDVCGFTSITETEKPDTVVSLLNSYFDLMVKEIITQNGHVDKFIGDAVMAVFRGDFHLDRAIEACLAIRNAIQQLPVESISTSFVPHVAIGINSGEMISGNIGSANLRRLDYTVVGDSVNTAQRLQGKAKPGQILISTHTFEKIKESFNCALVGHLMLKNKKNQMEVYEVLN